VALRRDDNAMTWLESASCRGPQAVAFYPPSSFERKEVRVARERTAKAICAECTVRIDCLDHALRTREPHGIWGGLNELERRDLLARREQRVHHA
jgi:WhiB family redox-sensing transcriptional regulator